MMWRVVVVVAMIAALVPDVVMAQDYGQRLRSMDGQWMLPTATRLLGSTDDDHVRRNSINSWDLSASVGSPVFAAAPGIVKTSGCYLYENRITPNLQGYGCSVQIDHGNGVVSQYGHCKEGTLYVSKGQQVTTDSLLCQVGTTGQTAWPHVHFTILRNGSPIRIASVFDINQMHYCKFCRATNDPNAPVSGHVGTQQQSTVVQMSIGERLLTVTALILVAAGPGATTLLLAAIMLTIMVVLWLSPNAIRVGLVASLVAGVCGIGTALLFRPVAIQATGQQVMQVAGDFDTAYRIVRGQEGKGCDTYIVRTLNGVTQWTYDRYNRERGAPSADVCNNLTEQEAKDIYYRYYWKPSGLDGVAMAVAIQVFDHSINAGVGEGKRIFGACGMDASCIANQRRMFYQSTKTCKTRSVVCGAWLRRVDSVYKKAISGS